VVAQALLAALLTSVGVAGSQVSALPFQGPSALGDSALQRAESLLTAGNLAEARRLAERLQNLRPRDPRVLMLLGRIYLVWPVVGRYRADTLFRRAAQLDPGNPEPLYYQGQVGLALGADDGEEVARRGFLAVLAIDPDYRDSWTLWLGLYRGDGERREGLAALERHSGRSWDADYWRAQLLIELRRYGEASGLLGDVIRRRPDDPGPRAWLARAQFLAGQDAEGAASYRTALDRASADTGQVLWKQVRGAATPVERQRYLAAAPDERAAFLRLWWSRREPDLSTDVNERMAEHFRRLADAQIHFALLHPSSRYFRSPLFRARAGGIGSYPGTNSFSRGLEGAEQRALEAQCSARRPGVLDDAAQAGLVARPEDLNKPSENLEDGLDDRGRIYLRHGRPDHMLIGSLADETWCYYRDGRTFRVTFVRRTGGAGATGDMVVTPLMPGESEAAAELLVTDNSAARNRLDFAFWNAAFRAADRSFTELLVMPDSVGAVAVLVDDAGREVARDTATGRPLHLLAPPGAYALLMDAVRGRDTSRYRGAIILADFGGEAPAISSILIAAGDVEPAREALAARAPRALTLSATQPLRVYTELYNLGRVDGTSRYRAEYWFERIDGGFIVRRNGERGTTIGFDREQPFAPRLIESLVVDPDRLPPGRYRLHIEIVDQVRGARAVSATIEFRLR
jgi:tetratricopeptide (TPR) repeat protein